MNRAIVSKRQMAILLGIIGVISAVLAFLIARQAPHFYLEVSMRSSLSGTAQVYYDTGRGINAGDSTTARLPDGESAVRLPLPDGEYREIRFDPIDRGYAYITIHQATIIDRSGHVLRSFSPEEFSGFHDISHRGITNGEIGLSLSAQESDPSFTISLAPPLALRSSVLDSWPFVLTTFFLCFVPLSALGVIWLLFAQLRWPWNGLLLCALAAFVYLFARSRFFAPVSFDEEVFIWYGWLVNTGSVPYRDIFEPKGPVIFFVNALGLSLFGLEGFLFRIVPTAVALLSIILFYVAMIRRRIAPWLSALLTAQVALWLLGSDFHDTGLNDSESYGFAFAILGFSLGLIGNSLGHRSGRITVLLLSGICFGLAVLSKELFVFSVIPAWVFLGLRRESGGWDWSQLLLIAAGGLLVEISFLSYLGAHSAFGSYLGLLRFSRAFAANYCIDIGRFPKVSGLSVLRPSWEMLHGKLYNFSHLAFVLPLWATFLSLLPRSGKISARLTELAFAGLSVVLGMVAVSIGYCFWKHYFLMGTTGLVLFSVIGAEALSKFLSGRSWRTSLLAFLGLLALFLYVASGPVRVMLAEPRRSSIISWDPLVIETIEKHSKPGDYILATEGPLIYVAMNRRAPIPVANPADDVLPYLMAENPMLMESLRDQLEKNLPKVCYFAGWFRPRQKLWHELLYDPLLVKYHYITADGRLWYLRPDDKPADLPEGY